MAMGAAAFVGKPFQGGELLAHLHGALGSAEA